MFLFEGIITNVALQPIHEVTVLVLQILHEVSAAVLLKRADGFELLVADLAF